MHDLLDECVKDLKNFGYITEELGRFKATCSKLFIDTEEKAKKLGFEKGHYFILNAPLLLGLKEEHYKFLKAEIYRRPPRVSIFETRKKPFGGRGFCGLVKIRAPSIMCGR